MPELQRRRPDLRITLIVVDTDPAAQRELEAISRKARAWPPGVPTFEIDGRVQVGFGDPASSGLSEGGGRLLKRISGVVMLLLGAVLLLRPQWLI